MLTKLRVAGTPDSRLVPDDILILNSSLMFKKRFPHGTDVDRRTLVRSGGGSAAALI